MARYLIDTNIFIWNIYDRKQISDHLIDILDDYNNTLYISRVSLIEIAIKNRSGKLDLGEDYKTFVRGFENKFGVKILEIDNRHLITLNNLNCPDSHKDPFDHTIISQSLTEKIELLSSDGKFLHYKNQGLQLIEN